KMFLRPSGKRTCLSICRRLVVPETRSSDFLTYCSDSNLVLRQKMNTACTWRLPPLCALHQCRVKLEPRFSGRTEQLCRSEQTRSRVQAADTIGAVKIRTLETSWVRRTQDSNIVDAFLTTHSRHF